MDSNAQTLTASQLQGTWELDWIEGGFFPEDTLIFKKSTRVSGQYVFHFENNNVMTQKLSDGEIGECPVGVFILKRGTWKLKDGHLTLTLKGDKIADYQFDYEIVYLPKIKGAILELEVVKVSKRKETQ